MCDHTLNFRPTCQEVILKYFGSIENGASSSNINGEVNSLNL